MRNTAYGIISTTAAIAFTAALAARMVAQTLSPGEVRINTRPYQPHIPVLRTESHLVRVIAVVRDGAGEVVQGLKPQNFMIFDKGKIQAITEFEIETREAGPPQHAAAPQHNASRSDSSWPVPVHHRYVALYLDDLHTKSGDMRHVQLAAENFIRTGLSAGDEVGLFTASSASSVDFTPDISEILPILAKITSRARVFDSGVCPRITPEDAYLIANHLDTDAYNTALSAARQCNCDDQANESATCYAQQPQLVMAQAEQTWEPMKELSEETVASIDGVVNYLAQKPGERVLVLASSGFLTGLLEAEIDAVIDHALRASIVVNALDAKGLYSEDPGHGKVRNELATNSAAGASAFKRENENFGSGLMSTMSAVIDLSVATGGRFFHDRNDLTAGYYSIAAAPETEYLLGFAPENVKSNGAYHKLKVEVNIPGKFTVQARPGYFAPSKEAEKNANQPTPEDQIDAEVRSSEARSDFPLAINEKSAPARNAPELRVQIHVDIAKLPFKQENGRRVDMLTFVAALFDTGGKMVAGREAQMQFALKPDSFKHFSESGINGGMSLEAPPGAYRLRVVVQEALRSQISAMTQSVRVQ